ncbi:MAG: T9SS type A sorting domain-containing protein, partial [Bacteroidales bacterium]|nr:T9SS type A sorting domain-containing protein [Bacteroidales bacterium]
DLKVVHRLFELRKAFINDAGVQQQLDLASIHLRNLEIEEASRILESIRPTAIPRPEAQGGWGPQVHLYPNPVNDGTLKIRFEDRAPVAAIRISDIHGRVVYETFTEAGQDLFSIEDLNLPHGIYFLMLPFGDAAKTLKFSVAR